MEKIKAGLVDFVIFLVIDHAVAHRNDTYKRPEGSSIPKENLSSRLTKLSLNLIPPLEIVFNVPY
ncbi:hypothetical protein SAMN05444506_11412 [Pseudomonas syringae]|nr:hypothetical protein SAMN05444506_11412 [Pseudomonas syringae]